MKKLLTLLTLLLALGMTCALAEEEPTAYTCGDYVYTLLEDGTAQIVGCDQLAISMTLPAEVDGHAVTAIGADAFYHLESLTSVTIPDGVTTIGDGAFYGCIFLTDIIIPDSVTAMGNGAFSGCWSLTGITIPDSVTIIVDRAFAECNAQLLFTVPRNSYAAQYCKDNDLAYTYPDANDWLLN